MWWLWQVFKWHDIKHEDLAKIKYEKKFWILISKSLEYENFKQRRIKDEESNRRINAFLKDQKNCHITTFGTKSLGWYQKLQQGWYFFLKEQGWYLKTKKFEFKKWTIFVNDKIRNQKCDDQAKVYFAFHFEVVLYLQFNSTHMITHTIIHSS